MEKNEPANEHNRAVKLESPSGRDPAYCLSQSPVPARGREGGAAVAVEVCDGQSSRGRSSCAKVERAFPTAGFQVSC